jgi:hypothetical protein
MVKKRKVSKKARKRGPKEETLVITGDPQTALDQLLKKPPRKQQQ